MKSMTYSGIKRGSLLAITKVLILITSIYFFTRILRASARPAFWVAPPSFPSFPAICHSNPQIYQLGDHIKIQSQFCI
jgi:hypothetical protein